MVVRFVAHLLALKTGARSAEEPRFQDEISEPSDTHYNTLATHIDTRTIR